MICFFDTGRICRPYSLKATKVCISQAWLFKNQDTKKNEYQSVGGGGAYNLFF